jgi:haloalkane dehalogenase
MVLLVDFHRHRQVHFAGVAGVSRPRFCAQWLAKSPIPKLFIDADPGGFLIGPQRDFCRAGSNQQEVTVKGAHFLTEEVPDEVAELVARYVAGVLVGQVA